MSKHITIPNSIEGLEQAMNKILSGDNKAYEEAKYMLRRARIIRDYSILREAGLNRDDSIQQVADQLDESFETVRYVIVCWQYR